MGNKTRVLSVLSSIPKSYQSETQLEDFHDQWRLQSRFANDKKTSDPFSWHHLMEIQSQFPFVFLQSSSSKEKSDTGDLSHNVCFIIATELSPFEFHQFRYVSLHLKKKRSPEIFTHLDSILLGWTDIQSTF